MLAIRPRQHAEANAIHLEHSVWFHSFPLRGLPISENTTALWGITNPKGLPYGFIQLKPPN